MNAEQLRAKFPNASADFIRQNATGAPIPPLDTAAARIAQATPKGGLRASKSVLERLNKTEARFKRELEARRLGVVGVHRFTLRIANDCRYTPDFDVVSEAGVVYFWEVKGGHVWEDSTIKLKSAASLYPMFRFFRAQWKAGRWVEQAVRP